MSRTAFSIFLFCILCLQPSTLSAQTVDDGQLLEKAEQDYNIGRFEQCITTLEANMNALQDDNKQKALRLIALCFLAQDKEKDAEHYARLLVEMNNIYSNVDDPIRFQEMISKMKKGHVLTVTTASSVEENINEAPVPVTIITAEMIENLGYNKNLKQILATYVPGMTEVQSQWDDNIAMHGAYARNQELILVMENGHRLNNRTLNSCSMDYSISTEKIDHIEVLRGPASSLYGNVALSAVVNIITKSGTSLNSLKAKYGYGTFNTHKADLTIGTRFMDADIFAWGSFYLSDGQQRSIGDDVKAEYLRRFFDIQPAAGQYAHIDTYKEKPCYDVGLTFKYKNFNLSFSRKNSRKVSQLSDFSGLYDYERYRIFDGIKPGSNKESTHAELGYTKQFRHVKLSASVYGDWYDTYFYDVESPEVPEEEDVPDEERTYSHGLYVFTKEREYTLGGNLRAAAEYRLGSMPGNLLIGAQFEHFSLYDHYMLDGYDYTELSSVSEAARDLNDIIGSENNLSFYVQDKQHIARKLILNAGARFDIKSRFKQDNITAFSPRLALIYLLKNDLSMKLTYSKSFVDMAYNYRSTGQAAKDGFLPQYLTAIQYSLMGNIKSWNITYDVNLSYNKYQNLYCVSASSEKNWMNEGSYQNLALEASLYYTHRRLSGSLSLYWCRALSAESYFYSAAEKRIGAVPNQTANLNLGWKVIDNESHQLKIYGNAKYTGKTLVQEKGFDDSGTLVNTDYYLKRRVIFDLGIKYTYDNHLQIACDCENLLNTDHYIAGPEWTMYPYYQRGRTVMASISYLF